MSGRAGVVWNVARDRHLLRLEVGFAGFAFAEHASWLAILVFAFERGGVGEAGIAAVVQLAPAIVVTPFAAYAGDRFRPARVLAAGYAMLMEIPHFLMERRMLLGIKARAEGRHA